MLNMHQTIKIRSWQTVFIMIGIVLLPLLLLINADFGLAIIVTIWYWELLYSLSVGMENIPFLMFLLMFYLFLLAAYVDDQVFHYSEGVVLFDKNITNHIYWCLGISLIFLFIGNYFAKYWHINKINSKTSSLKYDKSVLNVSLILFYICYIPYIITGILHALYSRTMGYTSLYLDDITILPYPVRLIAYMCPVFFYIFLASLPNKKKAFWPIFFYIIYSIITLFSGQRADFVINIIILIIYLAFRNKLDINKKWINGKLIVALLVVAPIIAILLNFLGQVRLGQDTHYNSFFDAIFSTLNSQGVSVSVIGYGKEYEKLIPNKIYSLGGIVEFFKYNPISETLLGTRGFSGQSAGRALNGNLFSHTISYLALPWGYLHGRGLGSCYIAEAYHDFGYLGVAVWSFIYGIIIKGCNSFCDKGVWGRAIILYALYNILMAPRSLADAFISGFLQIQVIIAFFIVWIISNYSFNKTKIFNTNQ